MSATNWIGWISLVVSVTTALIVGLRTLSVQLARGIVILTQLRETVEIVKVGIEALRMVDTDTANNLHLLGMRVEDLERYLQVNTIVSDRPFVLRYGDKKTADSIR